MNKAIEAATMFGFIRNAGGTAVVSNRIFESVLYNLFSVTLIRYSYGALCFKLIFGGTQFRKESIIIS